jgi:twitching motility protein PilT
VSQNEQLFGKIALELGFLNRDRLLEAGRLQNNPDESRRLGEILMDLGWIDGDQLRQILTEQRSRSRAASPTPALAPVVADLPPEALDSGIAPVPEDSLDSLTEILRWAVGLEASDVHLHSGSPIRFRKHGTLQPVTQGPLSPERVEGLTQDLLTEASRKLLASDGQADFALDIPGLTRFRVNAYRQQKGLDVVFRVIPPSVPSLEDLGLPSTLARLTTHHQGMVLVTGPSGCGKTSTLAALVNIINQERREHIITAEDPIEYLHESQGCLVNQRQVGVHSDSFANILRAALREDPDIIVVGELRDPETISLALTAAETGHLVLGTLHTGGAIRTINRLIGSFPPNEQEQVRLMLSESLRAVVSQRLVTRADGSGLSPALEIMIVTRAVSNLIREKKVFQIQSVLQTQLDKGMILLERSLEQMVKDGIITKEEADKHS